MSFFNRFSIFFVGVAIGTFIIIISMNSRTTPISFNYFPNDRIKSNLIKNHIKFSDNSFCQLLALGLDSTYIYSYIKNSKVNFSKSKIRGYDCQEYALQNIKDIEGHLLEFLFSKCDTNIHLSKVIYDGKQVSCSSIY